MKIQNKKVFYGELSDLCECVPGSPLEKHSFRRMKLSLWVSPVGRAGCVLSICAYVLWLFAEVATNPLLLVIHTMTVWSWVPPLPQKVQLASPSFLSGWPLTYCGTRCDASRLDSHLALGVSFSCCPGNPSLPREWAQSRLLEDDSYIEKNLGSSAKSQPAPGHQPTCAVLDHPTPVWARVRPQMVHKWV